MGGDQGAHFAFRIGARQISNTPRQARHQGIAGVADGDRPPMPPWRSPPSHSGAHQGVGGLIEISVGHHHHVIFGATQRLHPLL